MTEQTTGALFEQGELAAAAAMQRHLARQVAGQEDLWASVADHNGTTSATATGCGCECSWGGFCGGCGHAYCGRTRDPVPSTTQASHPPVTKHETTVPSSWKASTT